MKKYSFKKYFFEKISFIIMFFASTTIAILVMALTVIIKISYIPLINIVYAYLLSTLMYIVFLIYDYLKVRRFNNKLLEVLNSKIPIENILNINDNETVEQQIISDMFRKLHRTFEKSIVQYEEKEKQNQIFTNQWVHQMKTPVSVIALILQESNIDNFKDSIREENEKLAQGLNIMLYNARVNKFNHDFVIEETDIVSVLRKVINDNKKALIRNNIFPKIIGETVMVETDKKWIYFVLSQLLINAIKYTSAAIRNKRSITFNIITAEGKCIITIKDNGIGIPREDLGRIFDAFFTGKNGRKTSESTGMGLYLAKRICKELGHELKVSSGESEGAAFSIIFFKGKNIFKL